MTIDISRYQIFLSGKNLSNENMIQIYDKGIEYLQFRKLLEYSDKIKHAYTLKPLDFKIGEIENAKNDYKKICKALSVDEEKIYRPSQTHSDNIKKVENELPRNI